MCLSCCGQDSVILHFFWGSFLLGEELSEVELSTLNLKSQRAPNATQSLLHPIIHGGKYLKEKQKLC